MNIVERIRDICQKLDVPISRLEQDLGFGNGFLNPKKISDLKVSRLLKILNYLGISVADFFGPEFVQDELTDLQKKYNALDDHGRELVDLVLGAEYKRCMNIEKQAEIVPIQMIRHYLVPAAAGYASPIEGEDYEDIPLPDGAPAGADFCITVRGDSMEPYIPDGSLAYVKRGASLQEFDVGIFYVDGDALIKQWCVDYGGTLHLLSANPKREDANRQIPKGSTSTVVCFGKVLLDHRLPAPIYE
jgi:SOS-response transcriptional repressor LexA